MLKRTLSTCAGIVALYLFVETLSFLCLLSIRKLIHVTYSPALTALTTRQKDSLIEFLARSKSRGAPYARLDRNTSVVLDASLGWVTAPPDANSAGMRDDHEYPPVPRPGVVRVAAFGDSFTYGFEVPLAATWTRQIASMAPGIECLNYGVPAYGLDQAYLRYLKVGTAFHPDVVLIGYMSEDLARDVNVFRPFYWDTGWLFTKPRFNLAHGDLTLLPNPLSTPADYQNLLHNDAAALRRLGQNDYFYQSDYLPGWFDISPSVRLAKILWRQIYRRLYRPIWNKDGTYNVRSEAYLVTVKILDAFYRKVLDDGAVPVIVLFPEAGEVERRRRGLTSSYAPLLESLRAKGYRFIDTGDALVAAARSPGRGALFTGVGHSHLTPAGNAIVAKNILDRLNDWNLGKKAKQPVIPQR